MTITTDLEAEIRSALALRLQRDRTGPNPAWDDEFVARVMKAAGMAAGDVTDASGVPRGTLAETERAALNAAAMLSAGKAVELGALAREMLATFKPGPNGCAARVKQAQADEWRERLGEPGA